MKFVLVCSGKLKPRSLRELCDDYLERIRRMVRIDEREVSDDRGLARHIPDGVRLVTLEVHGQKLSSEAFARQLEAWASTGKGDVCFVIGGAEGLPADVRARSNFELSLSPFTLPHRLARLILLEQIYRGLTILRGEPYARED